MACAKSIRTEPRSHATQGAWRIRTAVPALSTTYAYDDPATARDAAGFPQDLGEDTQPNKERDKSAR